MARTRKKSTSSTGSATVGYEAQLWQMADALRGNMDAAEYKHVVLGLLFLKYISDAFEEKHAALDADRANGADPEDPDEYRAVNIFWVPPEARWSHLKAQAKQPTVGQLVDDAMAGIERDNLALKNVLPKEYARPALDKTRLGQLIDMISNIKVGDKESRSKDVLGRVYEYFLSQFASAEGKKGGEFYTPRCVVKLLVEMLEPYKGRVYDPCCGSSGMFVQSEEFITAHGGKLGDIAIYGQESNYTTWRLAIMNLAIRGIEADIRHGDTFHNDAFPDLKADYILANPPFNISDWGGERLRDDKRWKYGTPPAGNANFGWVQHIVHHLSPSGVAGFVLANGSMSSEANGEDAVRRNLVEADLVDCMISLPGHLFYSMYGQVCIWILTRSKFQQNGVSRAGKTLFIDARGFGRIVTRTHRELSDTDIERIAATYHSWINGAESDEGTEEFARVAATDEIRRKGYILTPARYVNAAMTSGEELSYDDMRNTFANLSRETLALKASLDACVNNLEGLGFGRIGGLPLDTGLGRRTFLQRAVDSHETLINSLFISWFVNFDPVRSKQNGGTLPPKIVAAFPEKMQESDLGDIPAGWKIGVFGDFLSPRNVRVGDRSVPEFSATTSGLEPRSRRFNKQLASAQSNNKLIIRDDLVFGLSRRVLNFGIMTAEIGSVSPVYEVFAIDTKIFIPSILERYIRYHMAAHMDILKPGAREGQPIDRHHLLEKQIIIPAFEIQQLFRCIDEGLPIGK